jgi:hypothetical protein
MTPSRMKRACVGAAVAVAVAGLTVSGAMARSSAVPAQASSPTLQGHVAQPFVGDTLSTSNGTWTGSPTKFAYQWDRCDAVGDRQNCVPIAGATEQSYTATAADVNHRLHANVLATNADGTGKADTSASGVVAPAAPPVNRTRPTISGTPPVVGSTLTANNGTWTGASTFSYQWQLCDASGNNCVNIAGATGKTYGVRSSDVGHELLARVRAANRFGATTADTDRTSQVTATSSTTVVTTTVAGNKAPTISFISLKKVGVKIYARFRVCDDSNGRVTVVERDNKANRVATRRFVVTPLSCGTYARSWILAKIFRTHGHLVVTLRAQDASGAVSRLVSKGLAIR